MGKVYKAHQLPSAADDQIMEWDLSDSECNIRLEKTVRGKVKLTGEWVIWNEEEQDWTGQPMTRDEIIDVINQVDPVIPGARVIHLKDKFFKKSAKG